jgi:hypothetical protein
MSDIRQDRPSPLPWPPIIYAAALIASWVLESVIMLPRLPESLIIRWIGALIFLAGLGLGLKGLPTCAPRELRSIRLARQRR